MTTETTSDPAPAEDAPKTASIIETIRTVIADELGKLFDTGRADVTESSGDPAPRGGKGREDVTTEVRAEVARLRADEARQAAAKSDHERIEELEKLLKTVTEAAPEEYRKITQRMWA